MGKPIPNAEQLAVMRAKALKSKEQKTLIRAKKIVADYVSNGFNKTAAFRNNSLVKPAAVKSEASKYFNRDDVKELVIQACSEINLTPARVLTRLSQLMEQDNNLNVSLEATVKSAEILGITGKNASVQLDAKDLETISELANAWKDHVIQKRKYVEASVVEGETKT